MGRRIQIWPLSWIAARKRRKGAEEAEKQTADMTLALARLGVQRPVPARVRSALRLNAWAMQDTGVVVRFPLILIGVAWFGAVIRVGFSHAVSLSNVPLTALEVLPGRLAGFITDEPGWLVGVYAVGAPFAVTAGAFAFASIYMAPIAVGYMAHSRRYPPDIADQALHVQDLRYGLVAKLAEAITACASAYGAGGSRRAASLRRTLAHKLKGVETGVLRAYSTRGMVPLRSHRRKPLRAHARLVASRLRAAEARLDVDGDAALPELAELLLTIAERYAHGQVGALLDAKDLEGVEPVRDREPLRVVAVILLTVAGAIGVSLLALPGAAEGPAIAGVGLLALTLVYGRRAARKTNILGPFGSGGSAP
ncbi:hypothetical protein [Streptomyces sp. NPDC088762]|uniref:hypothetical protein n=1 Tax=Streptomyces sp. NPDC088762 TaxID=3365891 RepID=UPI00381AC98D